MEFSIVTFIVDLFFKIFPFLPHKNKKLEAFKEQFKSVAFQEFYLNLSGEKIISLMTSIFGTNIHSEGLLKLREIKQYNLHKKDKRLIRKYIELFDMMIQYEELEKNSYIKYEEKLTRGNEIQDLYNDIKKVMNDAESKRSTNKN